MSNTISIALLFHESISERAIPSYRIWHCAQIWRRRGFEIRIVRGCGRATESDLVIPQIDLSVLPEKYRRFLADERTVVNRAVVDIRKSSFSRNLVKEDDGYDGPVIVKTEGNCGGLPDRRAIERAFAHRPILYRFLGLKRALREAAISRFHIGLAQANSLDPHKYPVFPSKSGVPRGVFKNGALVVEKFLPEREGRYYFLRSYAFFGSAGLAARTRDDHPVVKGAAGKDLEFVAVDPAILALREKLGFDYGKFDYVIHEGEAVLLDVNATPTFGAAYSPAVRGEIAARLAEGIRQWFPDLPLRHRMIP